MFVGPGATSFKMNDDARVLKPTLAFDVGVGTTPDASFIVGGYFHLQPVFGAGTDLALLLRAATRGYQAGGFGLALDAGGYARYWNGGSYGFAGGLVLGAPLGFEIHAQTEIGTSSAVAFGAVAGIDLLRLTVYRQSLTDYWYNPSTAQHEKTARIPRHLGWLAAF